MTKLSLTLVQCHLEWENPSANRRHIQQLLGSVDNTDIIVLPELFTTAFSVTAPPESMSGDSVQWMKKLAKNSDALIIGSVIIQDQAHKYNRLLCVFPNGTIQYYDKRHLFKLIDESIHFKAGINRLIVNYKGWRICPLICYDLRFPVFSRNRHDYDLLVYVANWPVSRIHHWTKLLDARAIENQSYVLGVNRVGEDDNGVVFNGKSRLVDATGNLLFEGDHNEQVLTYQLDYQELMAIRKKHPFLNDADEFVIL